MKNGPFEVFWRLLGTQGAWKAVFVVKNGLLEVFQVLEALGGPRSRFVIKTGLLGPLWCSPRAEGGGEPGRAEKNLPPLPTMPLHARQIPPKSGKKIRLTTPMEWGITIGKGGIGGIGKAELAELAELEKAEKAELV